MWGKIKKLVLFTTVLVLVLSVLGFAKYLHIQSGSVLCNGNEVTLTVSGLTHLSAYLNGYEYHSAFENLSLTVFVVLLVVFRALLLRKATI